MISYYGIMVGEPRGGAAIALARGRLHTGIRRAHGGPGVGVVVDRRRRRGDHRFCRPPGNRPLRRRLPAQGRAPVRFQNRGQAVPPASRTPHHSVLRLVRATLDRVLDQHGHVYTNESLLQNIGTR